MTKPLLKGVLKTWKEDRGFGFITPDHGGKDLFIHISALGQPERRPTAGDIIHYHVARDKHGKLRAVNAQIDGVKAQFQPRRDTSQVDNAGFGWGKVLLISMAFMVLGVVLFYLKSKQVLQ